MKVQAAWRKGLLLAAAAGVSGMFATACGSQSTILQKDANGPDAAAVTLYQNNCLTCHGNNLQGGIGPNLQHVGSKMSKDAITHQIDAGGGPMPGYGPNHQQILTTKQIQQLTDWLSKKK